MSELRLISRHAGTILVGQLAVMAFGVTDTIVAGRHSEAALAAMSIGSAVFMSVFVALMGILQALLPVWAELHGAGRAPEVGRSVRQAMYLCAATIAVGMVALLNPGPVLRWTAVPESLRPDVQEYLAVLALSVAPALLFRTYSTLNQSLGKPLLVTWLQIGSLFIKVPLSVWFAFGGLGLPAGGAVGCAWATLVVNYLMFATALYLLRTRPFYQPYRLWLRMERPDWPLLAQFARLGIPGGLAIMVEVTSFTLMALFIARLGTVASASHQVAASLAAVLYMVPLSLGLATSSRTSYWLGAHDARMARAAIRTGYKLAACSALLLAGTLLAVREPLSALYAASPAVAALAAALLPWVALYHLADTTQALSVFILRSFRVTVAPLAVYCVVLWGLGLGGGYALAYHGIPGRPAMQNPAAFWIASAAALLLTASVFVALVWRAVRHGAVAVRPAVAARTPAA